MRFCPDIQAGFLYSQSLALIFFDAEIRALKEITFELTGYRPQVNIQEICAARAQFSGVFSSD
jgi:hypothetical protein